MLPDVPRSELVSALADLETNTATTFLSLLLKEEKKPADNVVSDQQCTR